MLKLHEGAAEIGVAAHGERAEIDVTLERAADAVEAITQDGITEAMNRFN